jgi:hypothetical protein
MFDVQAISTHPVDVGLRSETAILAELVHLGYLVLVPWGVNQRYDFAIDLGDRLLKAQCKTGRLRQGAIRFATSSVRCSRTAIYQRSYEGEVDVFLVHCPQTAASYAIAADEVGHSGCNLRVDPPANSQIKKIRWARDHLLGEGKAALDALPPPPPDLVPPPPPELSLAAYTPAGEPE